MQTRPNSSTRFLVSFSDASYKFENKNKDRNGKLVALVRGKLALLLSLLSTGKLKLVETDVCWILDTACSVVDLQTGDDEEAKSGANFEEYKKIITQLGSKFEKSNVVQQSLFKLVTKLSGLYSIKFTLALFLNLDISQSNSDSLTSRLSSLALLNQELYFDAWSLALASIENYDSVAHGVELLVGFLQSVGKTTDEIYGKMQISLVTKSINLILSLSNSSEILKSPETMLRTITTFKALIASKSYNLTQFSVELTLTYVDAITRLLINTPSSDVPEDVLEKFDEVYIQATQVISNLILFQRFRFSNRQHLIMECFVTLMEALFVKPVVNGNKNNDDPKLLSISSRSTAISKDCALAFERLMGNLCEASSLKGRNFGTSSSSSTSGSILEPNMTSEFNNNSNSKSISSTTNLSIFKTHVRRALPVLIFNYLKFYIRFRLIPELRESLVNGLFLAFDMFTSNELNYVNFSLDGQSRVVFRGLYDDYKKFGRWRED
ncbi:unnamed protein product [Ambrosiozyma monospora]|uniref:Unnamed protein product n=1 Tax=Ambrosiozyma monospora TaxID=43982 RepID=A0A9W7DG63_AMBMO|nr:unnamed protein product [Ambrosiozyma monospora]